MAPPSLAKLPPERRRLVQERYTQLLAGSPGLRVRMVCVLVGGLALWMKGSSIRAAIASLPPTVRGGVGGTVLLLLVAGLFASWGVLDMRRSYRQALIENNLCPRCGCCLDGITSDACPECSLRRPADAGGTNS